MLGNDSIVAVEDRTIGNRQQFPETGHSKMASSSKQCSVVDTDRRVSVVVDMVAVVFVDKGHKFPKTGLWKPEVVDRHNRGRVVIEPSFDVSQIRREVRFETIVSDCKPEIKKRLGDCIWEVGRNKHVLTGVNKPGKTIIQRGLSGAIQRNIGRKTLENRPDIRRLWPG